MNAKQKKKFWDTIEESGWDSQYLMEGIIKMFEKTEKEKPFWREKY